MSEQDETALAAETVEEAPVTEAAPESGAPATPPEDGFEKRYNDLRTEFDRRNSLLDRVRQGDTDAARELQLEFAEAEEGPAEEDEEEYEPLTALEQRQAAIEQWAQQREAQEGMTRFNADLDELAAEKGLKLSQRERIAIFTETVQKGDSPEALKAVVEDLAAERVAHDKAVIDAFLKSKRAPHVSKVGTGANERPYRADMSLDERIAAAQEQARLASEQ